MKTFKSFAIITLLLLLSLTACQNSNTSSPVSSNSFTAVVNGEDFKAQFVDGQITVITNTLLLSGSMGDGEDIQLFLPQDIGAGTYSYETGIQGKYQKTDEDFVFANSGQLIIETHDTESKHIKGSFNFTGKPMDSDTATYTVENGSFSVHY
ncbi:DUF6252 family protein [Leeuwenhoekiella nanhaiensis]|uniref:Lipocalin-like domain-containing protein n=1 Tax=Leeuwenhoekiella nanhaiensis TaxID=1655491 RepID=A0A2G1VM94_9FLAO|nr:DUF6252 family protein [Leeuwenhoekiella nanhaiensis]PHQ27892.1 hypothetical protein CJ305_17650 [Leeuwenhoekiella nanhaiensis]